MAHINTTPIFSSTHHPSIHAEDSTREYQNLTAVSTTPYPQSLSHLNFKSMGFTKGVFLHYNFNSMGFTRELAFSAPWRTSTIFSANSKVVPGPRLVISFPSCTTRSSEYLYPAETQSKQCCHGDNFAVRLGSKQFNTVEYKYTQAKSWNYCS